MGASGGERLADTETTALPGRTTHLDLGAMGITDGFHDRQAETGAALVAGARAVDTEETLEYMGECFGRNADAVIRHFQHGATPFLGDLEFDAAAVGRVLDGV